MTAGFPREWPQTPVIYQVYPRSFADSTGNGTGDLNGITAKLDHVAGLGVDAVWLSPFYTSGWVDGGYDVIDHETVDPCLGTLDDFDRLVERAHQLGLRVMIDQVLNHTSDRHRWFQNALAGDDDYADRYLFRDPKPDGTPPNNWLSQFGLPGWEHSHRRRQYYFHQFLACQPSLNLRNAAVQESHRRQIGLWRSRGVDGFRFDAVTSYLWDESLADNPPASRAVSRKVSGSPGSPYKYQDHVYDMLPGDGAQFTEKLRDWAGADAYLIGEITSGNKSVELAMAFTGPERLNACYTTDMPEHKGSPPIIADMVQRADLHRLVSWLSSHDQPRHLRLDDNIGDAAAVYALLMAFLPGPWLVFQGEEWGLPQPRLEKEEITDPLDLLYWPDGPGREGARVPVAWTGEPPAYGFSTGKPWLPMRWGGLLNARDAVAEKYRSAIGARHEYGWGGGDVAICEHGDDWLVLEIAVGSGRYEGVFAMGGRPPSCKHMLANGILSAGKPNSHWSAHIRKLG